VIGFGLVGSNFGACSQVSLEKRQGAKRTHDLAAHDSGLEVVRNDATKVRAAAALAQMPAVSHAHLRRGSRVPAATGMDQRGQAGVRERPI
jgi:hypothetical protein